MQIEVFLTEDDIEKIKNGEIIHIPTLQREYTNLTFINILFDKKRKR